MIKSFNILLWPLSILYGGIAGLRRLYFELFDLRTETEIPTVIVGNLTVGGTGKTPMVLYVGSILKDHFRLAILSRGYGRKTKGFYEVFEDSLSEEIGDEPREIKLQSPDLSVFVSENRLDGIAKIHELHGDTNLVVMDDGFQHLPLRGKVNIILCNYHRPFYDDFVMPAGRLREFKSAVKGVDIMVVTKCPPELTNSDAADMRVVLNHYSERVFFATYKMSEPNLVFGKGALKSGDKVILVTGIADGKKVKDGLGNLDIVKHFEYGDHTNFGMAELREWKKFSEDFEVTQLVMTRKDWMRVKDLTSNLTEFGELTMYEVHTEVSFLFEEAETFKKVLIDLI